LPVISDDHRGLVKALRERPFGASSQRCRVHLTCNAQDLVPLHALSMFATAIRSDFEQPDERSAREQSGRVIESIRPRFPAVADLLADAECQWPRTCLEF
jgi:putative transposase